MYSIIFDNGLTTVSIALIAILAKNGVHVVICDQKHLPCAMLLPFNQHYRPLNVLRKQIALLPDFKDLLWMKIVKAKLINQSNVVSFITGDDIKTQRLQQFAAEVLAGDPGNREAIGAKMYFRTLFGSAFLRDEDSGINACLNYGYTIIRSAVSHSLVNYGYNCALGIHHIGELNPFNLADDLMEPIRPLVDHWVDKHHIEIVDTLTPAIKRSLVNLINSMVLLNGKKMKLHNALDFYVASLTTAIDEQDYERLKIPIIIDNDV